MKDKEIEDLEIVNKFLKRFDLRIEKCKYDLIEKENIRIPLYTAYRLESGKLIGHSIRKNLKKTLEKMIKIVLNNE